MALTVVVRSGDLKSQASITFDAPRIVIGRGDGCEIRLPDPSVSHRHASIRQRGTDYVLIDEGSTNGTFAGPVRLSPQAPRVIRSGDLIRVGRVWLELSVSQVPPTQNPGLATKEIALLLVASSLSDEGELVAPRVTVKAGPDAGKELVLSEFDRSYVVGRAANADLSLSDNDSSRRHVELIRRGTQVFVRELGSKNGALLGETLIESGRDTAWPVRLSLTIGASELVYEDPVLAALVEIEAGSDERMRDDDSIDPPTVDAGVMLGAPHAEPLATGDVAAPAARASRRPVPKGQRTGFRWVDLSIALVALAVIGLSLLGLSWLFKN
ncbi:MAG TPA: FHA domain-containing protein [Polyangiaceae bacterium]|jgi:pSer/pThr/pTyr-binding forkhead associated (FHA) protein